MNKKLEPYICVCLCRTEGDDPRPTDIEERFVLLLANNQQHALEKADVELAGSVGGGSVGCFCGYFYGNACGA